MENEEVLIAGDEDVGAAAYCDLEEVVVVRIAACLNALGDLDKLGGSVEEIQKFVSLDLGEVSAKLEAGGDVNEFGKLLIREEELKVTPSEELLEDG